MNVTKKYFYLGLWTGFLLAFGVSLLTAQETPENPLENIAENFARWLPDMGSDDTEAMKTAQQGWQRVCAAAGAPGEEAARAEVNALMTARLAEPIDPVAKTWLLYQLRWTATDKEIPAVASLLSDSDVRVRGAAARVLATLNTPKAVEALQTALQSATDDNRKAIQDAIALREYDYAVPVESVSPMNLPYIDDAQVAEWMKKFKTLDETEQARTLAALTARGDRKYLPAALAAIQCDNADIRRNGILALERLGTAEQIPLLLDLADRQIETRIDVMILSRIADEKADSTLLDLLPGAETPERFGLIADALVARSVHDALAPIIAGAKRWPDFAADFLGKAERLAGKEDIGRFVELMLTMQNVKEREGVERMIARLSGGDGAAVIGVMTAKNRAALLPTLGRIGGEASREKIEESFAAGTPAEKEAALRAYCNWPNAQVAERLFALADDAALSESARVAALRAYIRVVSLPKEEIGIELDDAGRLDALKRAFDRAARDDEKRLALDRAKSVRTPESLAFVLPRLDDEAFRETAVATILELAHHDFLRKSAPDAFRSALDKVITAAPNQESKDRAVRYKEMIQ